MSIKIKWVSTTPLWPQANREEERYNRTTLKSAKIAHENGQNLGRKLRKLLIATPYSSAGFAPFTLLFGQEMKTKFPTLNLEFESTVFERAAEKDAASKTANKKLLDRKCSSCEVQVGDQVVVRKR